MKEKKDELSNDKTKYNGISEFLKNAGINDFSESEKVKYKINPVSYTHLYINGYNFHMGS